MTSYPLHINSNFNILTYLKRVLGCYPLLSCVGEVLGMIWSYLKQVVVDEVCA